MSQTPNSWIIVTDFDGTLTEKDIGNELCKLFLPDLYKKLSDDYNGGLLSLREFQQKMWTHFPCGPDIFAEASLRMASLRPGVNEFFEACAHKKIPIYIASCGIDLYIQKVIERFFSQFAKAALSGVRSNTSKFSPTRIEEITAPDIDNGQPEPFHKGRWAREMGIKHNAKVIAIGNGGSDRTFLGHADMIFATEKLVKICEKAGEKFTPFENFFDILKMLPS